MTQIDPLQNLLHVVVHRQRLAGRAHAVAGADEQVILEIGTQLFQAVTDRRLADMQRLRNQRQVALLIHRDKDHQVLHVQLSQGITVEHRGISLALRPA